MSILLLWITRRRVESYDPLLRKVTVEFIKHIAVCVDAQSTASGFPDALVGGETGGCAGGEVRMRRHLVIGSEGRSASI